ncbi:nickel-binding protein [Labilibaculum sp.]|uniref:nickel-binding protein n=1 Tax=Labilibaculum sp. TaxID=2060723 RepID=UPI00356B2EB5
MPIYMDRHDVSDSVTAEIVAELHKEDLKIQHEFNCRGLTYWFDGIKKIAFCLIEAPNAEAIQDMHNSAHGEVPNQIIEVDPHLVESFLGRIKDPVNSSSNHMNIIRDPAQRTLLKLRIMALSLKDFNASKTSLQEAMTSTKDMLNHFDGRLVEQKGSHLLISFASAHKAVLFALKAKHFLDALQKEAGTSSFRIKMGLATGMPVTKNRTLFEETINIAHCLCFAHEGDIVVSTEVKEAIAIENTRRDLALDQVHHLNLSDENFLNQLIDFTEKEWQNIDLKVEDFSRSLGMSKTSLYRKMMSLTGKSPNNFIREYRLNKALEGIKLKMKSISEIAYESGFNSTSYFSKCFEKRFGLLPSVYLKSGN